MMREAQVRELHAAGMGIGAHTVTHPILLNTAPEAARREIVESGRRLSEILREPVRLFAYPNWQARSGLRSPSMCKWSVMPDSRPRYRLDGVSRRNGPTGFSCPDSRRGIGHQDGSHCG
jgi:peptidoglycan/xylan/chitin deacetylase (PgdA/CDA1 family)